MKDGLKDKLQGSLGLFVILAALALVVLGAMGAPDLAKEVSAMTIDQKATFIIFLLVIRILQG